MIATPTSVAFHIGVHKTATTHLQRCLRRAAHDLAANDVRYYGPDTLRLPGRSLQALFGLKHDAGDSGVKRAAAEQMALLCGNAHRLVLSEENFIGPLNQPQGRTMKRRYKAADARLSALAEAIGQTIDVHLAVRRPTAFINSAYCQMLLGGRVQPIQTYQSRNGLGSVDWVDLVSRLRAARGIGRVTVWRYEEYGDVFAQIITGLVGQEAAPLVAPRPRHINRGLSAAAVAQVLAQAQSGVVEDSAKMARKALPIEDGHAPFDGFSHQEHAIGDAAYGRQIAAIAQMDGVTLLRPDRG